MKAKEGYSVQLIVTIYSSVGRSKRTLEIYRLEHTVDLAANKQDCMNGTDKFGQRDSIMQSD